MSTSFTTSFVVDRAPEDVFERIVDVRSWWTGDIEGSSVQVGDEFTYRFKDFHVSRQRVTALDPGRAITWEVTDSDLSFTKDPHEWTGTSIHFDLEPVADGTRVVFTHVGLTGELECFDSCSDAWRHYVTAALPEWIETGKVAA